MLKDRTPSSVANESRGRQLRAAYLQRFSVFPRLGEIWLQGRTTGNVDGPAIGRTVRSHGPKGQSHITGLYYV